MRGWPRARTTLAAALLPVLGGCSDVLLPPDPEVGPEEVAEAIWTEVDEYYSYFSLKGVDWGAARETYLPLVDAGTSDQDLFLVMGDMLALLEDGHVALETPLGVWKWNGWFEPYPENYGQDVVQGYLTARRGSGAGGAVRWGEVTPGIGYIHVGTFGRKGTGAAVDLALEALGPLSALIVDVRHNGGGSDTESDAVAGRFVRERTHYRSYRYKTGPGHDDFGPVTEDHIEPAGEQAFHGPVVVLQNRRTFSAAEDFVLAMKVVPNVTFVGDHTGGGAGNPIPRELPNGWVVNVSRWQSWGVNSAPHEGTGLPPDVTAEAPDSELAAGRDRILERAVEILQGG